MEEASGSRSKVGDGTRSMQPVSCSSMLELETVELLAGEASMIKH